MRHGPVNRVDLPFMGDGWQSALLKSPGAPGAHLRGLKPAARYQLLAERYDFRANRKTTDERPSSKMLTAVM